MTNQKKSKQSGAGGTIPAPAPAVPPRTATKIATLIALLTRTEGATLDEMVAATGWQPHTTRAALTRLKARGYVVASEKADGVRTYLASGGPAAS